MADFHAVNDANTRRVLAECPAWLFFLPEDGVWEKYFVSCSRGLGQADIFCIFVQTTRAAKYKIYLAPAGERQGDIFYILLRLCAVARYKIYFAPPMQRRTDIFSTLLKTDCGGKVDFLHCPDATAGVSRKSISVKSVLLQAK